MKFNDKTSVAVGTCHGRLEGVYQRTALSTCATRLISPGDVADATISLREAAWLVSGESGQGIQSAAVGKCARSDVPVCGVG